MSKSSFYNIENWNRLDTYNFYKDFEDPCFNVTCNVPITNIYNEVKGKGQSLHISLMFLAMQAANSIENFRLRIKNEQVIVYDCIGAGSTILYDDETFGFAYFDHHDSKEEFLTLAGQSIEKPKIDKDFDPKNEKLDLIYFTSLPWIQFTSFKHAQSSRMNLSIPKITFGRYFSEGSRILIPANLEVHHALVDGLHVGKFFQVFEKLCNFEKI